MFKESYKKTRVRMDIDKRTTLDKAPRTVDLSNGKCGQK